MADKADEYTRAAILLSVRYGTIRRDAALQRYMVSEDEFALWELAFKEDGIVGLKDRRLSARRRALAAVIGTLAH
jgi:transposase